MCFFFSEAFVHVLCLVAEKEKKIEGNETKNLIMLFFFEIGKLNFTEVNVFEIYIMWNIEI